MISNVHMNFNLLIHSQQQSTIHIIYNKQSVIFSN